MTKGHDKGHKGQMSDREVMKLALEALEFAAAQIYNEDNDDIIADAITALRQALDHVPDTTKMIEPDMGIDRGAWSDVPDATKWVDELRGGDETEEEEEPVAWSVLDKRRGKHWYTHESKYTAQYYANLYSHREPDGSPSMVVTPLYAAPPKREWVGLTDEERNYLWSITPPEYEDQFAFVLAVEAKLKEKNT